MKDKMEILDTMISEISDYCDENMIEFIFAAEADNKQKIFAYHLAGNKILKEAYNILDKFIHIVK